MTEAPKTSVELKLPSRLGFEKVAMATAANVAALMGFPKERVEDLKTAVSEACINAIEHGNRLQENLSVVVLMTMDTGSLEVKVIDRGQGVTKKVSKPDMDRKMQGEEMPRGMGLFLIQNLVDELEFVSESVEGSYARLVIHLENDKGGK
jgi:serine/threonine-protein kinase RsbW